MPATGSSPRKLGFLAPRSGGEVAAKRSEAGFRRARFPLSVSASPRHLSPTFVRARNPIFCEAGVRLCRPQAACNSLRGSRGKAIATATAPSPTRAEPMNSQE